MLRSILRFTLRIMRGLLAIGLLALFLPRLLTAIYALSRLYSPETAPRSKVAIVFGAGLYRDGSPTPVLRDRVAAAVELYQNGKVEKLLMSGDHRSIYYNEPEAMKRYAMSLGIPEEAIFLDRAGHRTYDTCYRARAVFNLSEAILVTQRFHLPRALYTCRALGLRASGVIADRRTYQPFSLMFWNLRELPATLIAFLDVHFVHPLPLLGEPEPIFPVQSQ